MGRGDLRQKDLVSRSRRAARWLQPGLVVKRWMITSGLGLLILLLGAAVWLDLQPIYWTLESITWLLRHLTTVLPRAYTGPLVLLAGGAKLTDPQKRLAAAVTSGHAEVIGWLLKHGAQMGPMMLHDAALKGHLESMQVLLEHGAKVNALNADGATPLHDAALGGHTAAAALLLGRGAEIDAKDAAHGATPLFQAASWGGSRWWSFCWKRARAS